MRMGDKNMNRFKILALAVLILVQPSVAATFMPVNEKVAVESHLEDRLTKSLVPIIGEGNFVAVIDVVLNPERKETSKERMQMQAQELRTVKPAAGEVMPGLASNTEVSQVPINSSTNKTIESMLEVPANLILKISVVLLVDKKITPAQIDSMKKIASIVLSINAKRGDTITIQQVELNQIKALSGGAAGGGRQGFLSLEGILQYVAYFIAIVVVVFLFSSRIGGVTMSAVKSLKEGGEKKDSGGGAAAGLANALAMQQASSAEERSSSSSSGAAYAAAAATGKAIVRPFSFITDNETDKLIKVLEKEDSKVIADVISSLDPKVSAKILSSLGDKLNEDVFSLIATDRELDRGSIDSMEEKIKTRIEGSLGGSDDLLKIINNSSSKVAEKAIEALKRSNPEEAAKVRARIVLFSDLTGLDDQMLIKVILKSKIQDVAIVIQASEDAVKEKFNKILPEESAAVVKEWLEMMPKQSEDVVEAAKRRLTSAATQLEKSGEITINRG